MKSHSYAIPHLTLRLEPAPNVGRKRFLIDGKPLVVEAAATHYLRSEGWWVLSGSDASLFFAVLSANFSNSFFAEVCVNYVGPEAPALIAALETECQASLRSGKLSSDHLNAAADFLTRYYAGFGDQHKFRRLANPVGSLPANAQTGLLRVYRALGYFTKGIPDLFAIKHSRFAFFEVKSENDALRSEQYVFAEAVLREVEASFQILRILGASQLLNSVEPPHT